MTVILQKNWTDLNTPDWLIPFEPNGLTIENNMLKMTGNLATEQPARRPRVYTTAEAPLPDEYYMKAVFMFPAGHPLKKWQVFFEPLSDQPAPYTTLQFVLSGATKAVDIEYKNVTNQVYIDKKPNVFTVTYGTAFEIIVHIVRHKTDGLIEAWINRTKVYTYQGKTIWKADSHNLTIVADNYKGADEQTNSVYQKSIMIATTEQEIFGETPSDLEERIAYLEEKVKGMQTEINIIAEALANIPEGKLVLVATTVKNSLQNIADTITAELKNFDKLIKELQ